MAAFQSSQSNAVRPSGAEDARTWVQLARYGTLATVDPDTQFPSTAVVEFAADAQGRPVFAVSTLSPHTAHLANPGRISLCVTAPSFTSLADGRVSLVGTVRPVSEEEKAALREVYLKKYPQAFYVDFGDFKWYVLDQLTAVRYNGGFAAARKVTPEEYLAASPDPVAAFAGPVCGHMNDDHVADTLAMVAHYTGLTDAEGVKLLTLDRLGMNAEVKRKGQTFKMRLPFVRPAEDRKGVKDVIVEMTRAARAATKPAAQE